MQASISTALLAEHLLRKYSKVPNSKDRFARGMAAYHTWRKYKKDLATLPREHADFIRSLEALVYDVEDLKLALCKSLRNWALEVPLNETAPLPLLIDPFSPTGPRTTVMVSAADLRDVFIRDVWTPHLRQAVRLALNRARDELHGAPISVVLLSGGTANIGWLRHLLLRDFAAELGTTDILRLPDFQEVVAKGLAVECARRFHTNEGDFASQTYNRLCLVLAPDGAGHQLKKFVSRTEGVPSPDTPGVLLPSASAMRVVLGKPIRWRVHLDRPPRHSLEYHFLRSTFDPNDLENLQNVEQRVIHTPAGTSFDPNIHIELTIATDGTASPRFIYRAGTSAAPEQAVVARPFYLDMTYGSPSTGSRAYLGFDFGTSNSAISFVDQKSVDIYLRRSSEQFWNTLSDLVGVLPYPIAAPLSQYLGQLDAKATTGPALEVLEGALALAAYVVFLEYRVRGDSGSKMFRGFTQRSAGPLWGLLKDCLLRLGEKASISKPYRELLTPELFGPIDQAVNALTEHKHGKMADNAFDPLRSIQILCNITSQVFSNCRFGYFQQVVRQRFSEEYRGYFRHRAYGITTGSPVESFAATPMT
jgi:hypothetical protein